jgi:hypothetical protein
MSEPEVEAREGLAGYAGAALAGALGVAIVSAMIGLLLMPEIPSSRVHGWTLVYLLASTLGLSLAAGLAVALVLLGVLLFLLGLAPWRWFERRPPPELLPPDVPIRVREEVTPGRAGDIRTP